jgi:putative ABC transport system ATP-binding protein
VELGIEAAVALEARELYRFFHAEDEEIFALRGVSLGVEPGEFVAVVGPSGSGKSTLLACLAGLDDPDGGSVWVGGERISRLPESERAALRSRSIGMLLQSGNLIEHLSVLQNVRTSQALGAGKPRDAMELLTDLGLGERASAHPRTLSGGETARAGIAVALANDPPVLLADEPTGEVDTDNEAEVLALLHERASAGTAVVVVTHSERVAVAADRIVRLEDGRISHG